MKCLTPGRRDSTLWEENPLVTRLFLQPQRPGKPRRRHHRHLTVYATALTVANTLFAVCFTGLLCVRSIPTKSAQSVTESISRCLDLRRPYQGILSELPESTAQPCPLGRLLDPWRVSRSSTGASLSIYAWHILRETAIQNIAFRRPLDWSDRAEHGIARLNTGSLRSRFD